MRLPIILTICLLLLPQVSLAQRIPKSSNGCVVKDSAKPSLFLSYEAAAGPDNDKAKTLLRLHNNTNCNIVVETSDILPTNQGNNLFKSESRTLANGNTETKFTPDPPEGALLPIYYDKQQTAKHKPVPANYWEGRDLIFYYTIPGGRSVTFPVDAKLFRTRFLLSVPFTYEWEHDRAYNPVEHRVYYDYELPSGYEVVK